MTQEEIKELGTGLPLWTVVLLDEENPQIVIDWSFLRNVLCRLRSLEKFKPNHLAKADIPRAIKYATDAHKKLTNTEEQEHPPEKADTLRDELREDGKLGT